MDNYTQKCTPITTHEHFCELAEEFDNKFKTTTLIGFDNLTSIWQRFPLTVKTGPDIVDYVHFRIVQNIKIGFIDKSRTRFRSEDYFRQDGWLVELHFFNSLYRYLIDLRAGKKLYGPMSISKFENGHCQIHPGAHRIAMCNVYKQDIMYVLTDYNKTIKKNKRQFIPKDTNFDWRRGRWAMREMSYNNVYWQSTQREKKYKDIIDQLNDDDEHSFHHPQLAERTYVLDGDRVLVNDIPVCEVVDHKWRICCV